MKINLRDDLSVIESNNRLNDYAVMFERSPFEVDIIETCKKPHPIYYVGGKNAFYKTCTLAFHRHRGLVLSPDIIWLSIVQAFSIHINCNAEELRHKFVNFDGKKKIQIGIKGSIEEATNDFANAIKEHIGEVNHKNIVRSFSTTTNVELTVQNIMLMDSMKNYFEYVYGYTCGLPSITIEGTVDDWIAVKQGADNLREYGLDWWIRETLSPVLDEFILAVQGNPNVDFWKDFVGFKFGGMCSPSYDYGHFLKFFPLALDGYKRGFEIGYEAESGLAQVKVGIKERFIGGFIGYSENANMEYKPEIGWLYANVTEKEKK